MLFHCRAISNILINLTGKKEKEKRNRHTIISDTEEIKAEDIESSLSGNDITILQSVLFYLCLYIRKYIYKYIKVQTSYN